MKTMYRVKMSIDLTEPYWMTNNPGPIVRHKNNDEYIIYDDENAFYKILDDFLDAPEKPLAEKDIQREFGANREGKLSKSRVDAIKTYYNGRFALKKTIYADLSKINAKSMKTGFPKMLKYSIPIEMNYFSCEDDDLCDKLIKSNESYIEIEIAKVDDII